MIRSSRAHFVVCWRICSVQRLFVAATLQDYFEQEREQDEFSSVWEKTWSSCLNEYWRMEIEQLLFAEMSGVIKSTPGLGMQAWAGQVRRVQTHERRLRISNTYSFVSSSKLTPGRSSSCIIILTNFLVYIQCLLHCIVTAALLLHFLVLRSVTAANLITRTDLFELSRRFCASISVTLQTSIISRKLVSHVSASNARNTS